MNKTKFVVWPALTPALSPGRGRILRRVFNNRELSAIRALPSANYQPAVTAKLNVESPRMRDRCPLSPGERVRVRASVPLTFLFRSNIRRSYRPCVTRQRMRRTFLERVENHITDELLLSLQLPIPETNLFDAHRGEKFGSFSIMSLLSWMPMVSTVKFNGEAGFHAEEIKVVNPARVIASELVTAESPVAQPTPHEFFRPSLLLPQCAGAVRIGHGKKVMRLLWKEKNGVHDRPHPGPLPQERENRSSVLCGIKLSHCLCVPPSELPENGDRQFDSRTINDARKLFPLPGGEEIVRRRLRCRLVLDCSTSQAHISKPETGGVA
jgi:hypothetical protein